MPSQSNNKCHRFRRGGHQLNGRDRTERSSELHVDRAYYSSRWSRHLNRISGRLFRIPDWTGSKRKEWVHCLDPRETPEAVRSGSGRPGRHVPPRVSPSRTRENSVAIIYKMKPRRRPFGLGKGVRSAAPIRFCGKSILMWYCLTFISCNSSSTSWIRFVGIDYLSGFFLLGFLDLRSSESGGPKSSAPVAEGFVLDG